MYIAFLTGNFSLSFLHQVSVQVLDECKLTHFDKYDKQNDIT